MSLRGTLGERGAEGGRAKPGYVGKSHDQARSKVVLVGNTSSPIQKGKNMHLTLLARDIQ
jgi:hypothetical protein